MSGDCRLTTLFLKLVMRLPGVILSAHFSRSCTERVEGDLTDRGLKRVSYPDADDPRQVPGGLRRGT